MGYTKHDIRKALIYAAKAGDKVFYSDLAVRFSIPKARNSGYETKFYRMLEDIGEEELFNKRPLLNSLVIRRSNRIPGLRFFSWYQQYTGNSFDWTTENHKKIASECQEKCFKFWGNKSDALLEEFCKTINSIHP